MIIRTAAMLFTAFALAACSFGGGSGGPDMGMMPGGAPQALEITSAVHSDYVVTTPGVEGSVRFEADCSGASCTTVLFYPGAGPGGTDIRLAFTMNCEGSVCAFGLNDMPDLVPIDFKNGRDARLEGATEVETEFGTLTTEVHRGVTAADIPGQDFPGLGAVSNAFSGWGDWGAFVISHVRTPGLGSHIPLANSVGFAPYENPVAGAATWTGIVGAHTYTGTQVAGNADLTVDFAGMGLDVAFTGMRDGTGKTYDDLNWRNLAIVSGGFALDAPGESIEGRFYGPNHEEAGGIFERGGMVGGFHMLRSRP